MPIAPDDETNRPNDDEARVQPVHPQAADHDNSDSGAGVMSDRLTKDIASWRDARSDDSTQQATKLSVAVARPTVPPTNARMNRGKAAVSEPKPATPAKKPFGMSYDGTSRADYIKLMISRGAR